VYFLVIIIILVVVIILLFYLVYKIYVLHVKSYEDEDYEDEEAELCLKDHVDGPPLTEVEQSSQESLSSKTGSSSLTDETAAPAVVQPNIKTVLGPILTNVTEELKHKNGAKEGCSVTLSFEYVQSESKLLVTLTEASNVPKVKNGSSEPYVDIQVTPYKHRTYRPPGFRRPLRGCLKRPVDFSLDQSDVNIHYFVLYLLRYDPFSRLKVDGELKIHLESLENLLSEEVVTITRELSDSNQQFTGFILRHGNESARSLNGSPIGLRRSFEDSTRSSSRSFNGFSRALDESSTRRQGFSNGSNELTPSRNDKFRESSRSFGGVPASDGNEFGPLGLTRSKTDKPRRKKRSKLNESPLVRSPEK